VQCPHPNELFGCSHRETALGLGLSHAKEVTASRAPSSSLNFPNISSQCVGDRQRNYDILTILLLDQLWERFPTIAYLSGMWRREGVTLGLCWVLDQREVLWQEEHFQRGCLRCLEHI